MTFAYIHCFYYTPTPSPIPCPYLSSSSPQYTPLYLHVAWIPSSSFFSLSIKIFSSLLCSLPRFTNHTPYTQVHTTWDKSHLIMRCQYLKYCWIWTVDIFVPRVHIWGKIWNICLSGSGLFCLNDDFQLYPLSCKYYHFIFLYCIRFNYLI